MGDKQKTVLACGSFLPFEENLRRAHPDHTFHFLSTELHGDAHALRQSLEKALSSLSGEVYLLYGSCAYPLIGMEVPCDTLHLYQAPDCFRILSGEREERGIYYITQGLSVSEGRPSKRFERLINEQGRDRAEYYMKTIYESVKRIIVLSGFEAARKEASFLSSILDVPIEYRDVDLSEIHAFLDGELPEKDIDLQKGMRISARCYLKQEEIGSTV